MGIFISCNHRVEMTVLKDIVKNMDKKLKWTILK